MRKNTKETNEKQNTKKIKKQSPKRILVICLAVFVLLGSVLAGSMWGFTDNITDQIAQEKNLDFSSIVYYIDEETKQPVEYDRLYAEQNRIWVDLENTPEMLKKAFIAIEDERFLKHHGIDLKRTLGATIGFIFKGSDSYGGSTITQQLIKNITGDNKRGPIRKVREMFRAINLEQKMSKDDIIELYMNTIYLGQGVHGVQAASNVYFSKDVSQLTLAECASIAGITQYPSRYDPLLNYEAHKEKQELVLGKMLELEYITQEEHDAAVKEELKLVKGTAKTSGIKIQSYYIDQIVSDVTNDLMTKNKMTEDEATKLIFKGGLKIYANVDPKVQTAMESVMTNEANFPGGSNKPQSAMVVIDPYTGQIKGIVGGRGEKKDNRGLNRATQTIRQVGSAIKPLAVYAPAIEYGYITPATIVDDTPLTIGNWSPKNSDRDFMGPITARVALEKSRNIPAVRILDKLSVNRSFDFMTKNLGFSTLVDSEVREDGKTYSDKFLSSLGLGGLTDGVSVLEMTAAYAPFVNGGVYYKPTTYSKVIDSNGRVILENKTVSNRAMTEETAYTMAHMLSGVVTNGTGGAANLYTGVFAGGKTGTTDDDTDRWFAGITPNYVGVVWFGYDQPKPMSGLGNPCVSVWRKVMDTIYQDTVAKKLPMPSKITSRVICQESGKIAAADCTNVRTDYFRSGTQPNSFCTSHGEDVPEDKIDDTIQNTDQGLNDVAPGTGANNPPAEGDVIIPGATEEPSEEPSSGNDAPIADDESQYWWSGDE